MTASNSASGEASVSSGGQQPPPPTSPVPAKKKRNLSRMPGVEGESVEVGIAMSTGVLIEIDPPELRFPFELEKEISCSVLLSNKTHDHVAFLVMTTSWNCMIWPNREILLPQSTCKVECTMFPQFEAPPDMQCEDLFLVKSVVTFPGATRDDIRPDMFTKESGYLGDEVLLRAVYVSPSPIYRSGELLEIEPPEVEFLYPQYFAFERENPRIHIDMTTGQLIEVNPPELRFPFELEKEISCSILLSNKTDDHIAFKVMTTSWDCIICPNRDILLPRSTCKVEVMKFAQSEAPPDVQCEDLFVIKSMVTFPGATRDDLRPETFTEESGNMIDEVVLQAVYVSPSLVDRSINLKVSAGELYEIEPPQLEFPFELEKQINCSIQLSNKTDDHVAFRFRESNWVDYIVRPSSEIILPRSMCKVVVTMQAQSEAPSDRQCNDWFLVEGVITFEGATRKDITHEMFSKEAGNTVDQIWLPVVYVSLPNPSSPFPGGCDEGSSCGNASWEFGYGLRRRRVLQSDRTLNPDDNFAGHIETSTPKAYQVQKCTGRWTTALVKAFFPV